MPVLERLTFDVAAGEALILRGPNGAGKTTLLRTLVGLLPPIEGQITVPDAAYAAHADGLKATLSVLENLTFWAEVFGTRDVSPAIKAFDLEDLQDRPAGRLSAGQKRRLGLARLMVTGRKLWVMDEPTVSLDASSVAALGQVLQGHLTKGGALIIATHLDLGIAGRTLDVTPFKAAPRGPVGFDEAFA